MEFSRSQVYLPKLTKDNEKVLVWGVNANYGPEYFHHERGIESFVQLTELLMQDETCNGFHCICDFGNIKLGHIPKFHPMALKKLTIFVEGVLGTRIKSLFLVNVFPFVDTLVNTLFKPLLPKKIISRLQISRTSDILLEHFDKAILPKDLGGEEKSLIELSDMMMKKYESMKSRFDKFNSLKTIESKRPTKLENDDILGYYGSFKKIAID
ncbi:hypothetical protein ABEB36_012002 [Hypothenemus hampei]|uniref:CRAL-TRIO domain-containing protein n=1 Tax=Hypothenemus hampei TaxID=57062 RepID=A0ABD1EAJ5_HYPHA